MGKWINKQSEFEQPELKPPPAPESPSTQPQMAGVKPSQDDDFEASVRRSPSQADRRAAMRLKKRKAEQPEGTPPTEKKAKSYPVAVKMAGDKRERVYLGGFKTGPGRSPKRRKNFPSPNGFDLEKTGQGRLSNVFGGQVPGLRRVGSMGNPPDVT
jgi:hypothetical protein